ncbi:hypothetical protein [Myroides injenensis]|uniref:hypothetical protein n=1 Tax=Myroides injenensis TaxID=1183151 RepID=UPI000289D05A|nr:hypothetical protein [Myroides injenensis]
MKKLVLSVMAVAAFGFAANAQEKEKPSFGFQENNIFVEGTFQISNTTVKPEGESKIKETNYTFNPKIGYMLSDKVAIGASLAFGKNYDFENALVPETAADYFTNIYAGAFARYYFLELGNRFKTYAEVGVGFNQEKAGDYKVTGVKTGLNVGFNYFLTDNLAVAFDLGDILKFQSGNAKFDGDKLGTNTDLEANVNVFNNFFDNAKFGLIYKF